MKIFGIGLSRTGTTSLAQALRILGYRVYDFPPIIRTKNNKLELSNLKFLDKFDAFTDTPVARFYKELEKLYPKSKFILTHRDINDWLKSCEGHMTEYRRLTPAHCQLYTDLYGEPIFNKEKYKRGYNNHYKDVSTYFKNRKDDLLIIDLCDGGGWEKLCPFLDKAIPDKPFPDLNKGAQFQPHLGLPMREAVYTVVPSMGNMRCELMGFMIKIENNPRYRPLRDWVAGKPSEDARCRAITKFLDNPELGDWLFFVDSDTVPPDNIFDLLDIAKEKNIKIISGLYHSFQFDMPFHLAFEKCEGKDAYRQSSKLKDNSLIEVDATGAGCLFIHREVLEKFKKNKIPPFHREYKEDGQVYRGEDFYFCRKSQELGYKIYLHTGYLCSHYKGVDLKRMQDLLAMQQQEYRRRQNG